MRVIGGKAGSGAGQQTRQQTRDISIRVRADEVAMDHTSHYKAGRRWTHMYMNPINNGYEIRLSDDIGAPGRHHSSPMTALPHRGLKCMRLNGRKALLRAEFPMPPAQFQRAPLHAPS